jgi:hypothetical protein
MTLQLIGAALLVELMRDPRTELPDLAWLLHGPTDEELVRAEAPPPAFLMAAE